MDMINNLNLFIISKKELSKRLMNELPFIQETLKKNGFRPVRLSTNKKDKKLTARGYPSFLPTDGESKAQKDSFYGAYSQDLIKFRFNPIFRTTFSIIVSIPASEFFQRAF